MISNTEKRFRSKKLVIKWSLQFISALPKDRDRDYVRAFSFNNIKNRTLAEKLALSKSLAASLVPD